ncbi:MAG: indole-3-glycerol-phosphate synthase [Chloroflexota bacterium]|nr:indole-3-glycerol-phosphate synthase [Chloroflexota bacterium]MDE3100937.1 indole-3-glycerol-phosphate synthase [Chloroflexota bacterium]
MSDFLERVVAERRADAENASHAVAEADVVARARRRRPTRAPSGGSNDPFTRALAERRAAARLAVIAEVKRASPSQGVLGRGVDVRALARRYAGAGAAAISVLCEPRHWGGSLADLSAVRESVDVPVLCKDVIVTGYQVAEACSAGASAVLLIAEALDDEEIRRLATRAFELGMGVLIEAHETAAFERAVRTGAAVVGVNARDLRAPAEIRPERIRLLHHLARPEHILVAESGIGSEEDARALPARVDAVLVGAALMRASDPGVLVRRLASLTRERAEPAGRSVP